MATKKGIFFLWRSTQRTWLQDIIRQCGVACSRSISWVQSRPVELVEVTWKFLLQLFLHLVPKVFYGVSASLSCRIHFEFSKNDPALSDRLFQHCLTGNSHIKPSATFCLSFNSITKPQSHLHSEAVKPNSAKNAKMNWKLPIEASTLLRYMIETRLMDKFSTALKTSVESKVMNEGIHVVNECRGTSEQWIELLEGVQCVVKSLFGEGNFLHPILLL